jgi:hemolysin activation/secretion protein
VESVRFDGATVYPEATLRRLAGELTGPAVPLDRIETARLALLDRYRADGYLFVAVSAVVDPPARTVRFVVIEGHIAEVRLEGDIGPAGTQVLRFLNRLTEQRPINQAWLERFLLLAQDVPGVSLRAVLRPSAAEPGALQLVAQVARRPFGLLATLDNRAYRLTGPEQGLAILTANSFTEFGERVDVSHFRAAGNTQIFTQGALELFLGATGLRVRGYVGGGRAEPSGDLRRIGYESDTTIGGASLIYPIIRARSQALTISLGLDYFSSSVITRTARGRELQIGDDELATARLTLDWARQDSLAGASRPAVNVVSLRASRGIVGLTRSRNDDQLAGRLNQEVDFLRVSGEASRSQTLFELGGVTVGLFGLVTGQWTDDILPSSEKYFLGGNRITRGFYAGEVTGDRGIATSLELQFTGAEDITVDDWPIRLGWQAYGFVDRGWARSEQRLDPEFRLSTFGAGLRVFFDERVQLSAEWARRQTRRLEGTNPALPPLGRDAYYWQVLMRF